MEQLNEKLEQKYALEALRDQVAQAPGGTIQHNGEKLRRGDLPRVIAVLEREIAGVRTVIEEHDKRCRSAHLGAAQTLQKGWPEYLQGLLSVLHYADHTHANLRDAQGYVINIYNIVTADGRVSSSELTRLIDGCDQLYAVLNGVYEEIPQVTLDRTLLRRLEVESWSAMLEEFKLPPPNRENIGEWLDVIDGWVGGTLHVLGALRDAALEQLLLAESQVAKFLRDHLPLADAPPPAKVPRDFRRLMPGSERPRQKRLDWWDRFQTADGVVPAIARSSVALGIVGGVVVLGANFGTSSVTVFNSLALPLSVEVGDEKVRAAPFTPVTVEVPQSGKLTVRALTAKGELIESFDEDLDGANARYVYNVAGAVPLVQWTAVYTSSAFGRQPPKERQLGTLRWSVTHVDHVFEEPPEQIQVKENSAGYRDVLSATWQISPYYQSESIKDEKERARVIHTHVRWDATDSAHYYEWLALASEQPGFEELFAMRLKEDTSNVMLLRFEQDRAVDESMRKFVRATMRAPRPRPPMPIGSTSAFDATPMGHSAMPSSSPHRRSGPITAGWRWRRLPAGPERQLPGGRPAVRKSLQVRDIGARVSGDRRRARAPDQSRSRRQPARSHAEFAAAADLRRHRIRRGCRRHAARGLPRDCPRASSAGRGPCKEG